MSKYADKLTKGECRLFLLSEGLKNYPMVVDATIELTIEGSKFPVINMSDWYYELINHLLAPKDIPVIRAILRSEWRYADRVIDNGKNNLSDCEYCMKQHIRYRFICENIKTRVMLDLGSVCVGKVIYGEEAMADRKFRKDFVEELEKSKVEHEVANAPVLTGVTREKLRLDQATEIRKHMDFLNQADISVDNTPFLASLQKQWLRGSLLTANQMESLRNMAKFKFKSDGAKREYLYVDQLIKQGKADDFIRNCKRNLVQWGQLTAKQSARLNIPETF